MEAVNGEETAGNRPVSEGPDGGEDTRDELSPRHGLEIIRQGVDRRAAKTAQEPTPVLFGYLSAAMLQMRS